MLINTINKSSNIKLSNIHSLCLLLLLSKNCNLNWIISFHFQMLDNYYKDMLVDNSYAEYLNFKNGIP